MAAFLYEFEWDPVKDQSNFSKHGLDFERAATVFLDPFALTIPDEEHSGTEARRITLGEDVRGHSVLVVHMKPEYDFSQGERASFFGRTPKPRWVGLGEWAFRGFRKVPKW